MTAFLYITTVLVWGSTWIALKLQLGAVPIVWSIVWRFALAALVLFAWLIARRQLRVPVRAAWALVGAQGICLFCVNFICFMNASRYIPSGLVAVVFSTSTLWNALGARLVFRRALTAPVLGGGAVGLLGLTAMFWPEIAGHGASPQTAVGLAWALGEKPALTNAWGMAWGAVVLAVGSLLAGVSPAFDFSPTYVGAWLYLATAGSVVGFTAYLMLVGRLGPERAAYCTVLFPLVALSISSVVEGYRFTPPAIAGLLLVMAGNVLIFRKPRVPSAAGNGAR